MLKLNSSHYAFWVGVFLATGIINLRDGQYILVMTCFGAMIANILVAYSYRKKGGHNETSERR